MQTFDFLKRGALLAGCCAALMSLSTQAQAPAGTWVPGITEPINDVALGCSFPGILAHRFFKEGDLIKKGEAIMDLDKRLEELEMERRKYVMDLHKTDLESTQVLFKKGALSVSREEMDKKLSEYNVASVEFELAKEQLKRRQVVAPFEGMVTEYLLNVGEACQANQPLVRLVDTRRCYFIVNVDAKAGYALKAGQSVKLEVEAGATPVAFTGTIFFVSPVVDPASGLMKVKVIFENPNGQIRPGAAGRMLLGEAKA
jgi:RND family efflux transporter MFP subunit